LDAIKFTLKDYRVWAQLGESYFKVGNYKEALNACEKSLELRKNYLPAVTLMKKIRKRLRYKR
jgi:tetratricopeptide (TPR) repeat protein